jgi:pimeloyl-ACP methyl ester carboxylesterase
MLRQSVATLVGDRTARLRSLRVPTLVIHGADDVMCNVSGGQQAFSATTHLTWRLRTSSATAHVAKIWVRRAPPSTMSFSTSQSIRRVL